MPRLPLLTIYKSFIRPPLNYGDIIYDQAYNVSFHQKLDSIQYNAALAITGAIRGSFKEKLYDQLGLETIEKKDATGNFVAFLRFSNVQSIYSILFALLWVHKTQEIVIIFLHSN